MPVYDGIVAFDFGTTNSCAVVLDLNQPSRAARIVPLDDSSEATPIPSAILYRRLIDEYTREYEIGLPAKRQAILLPESVVQSIKRSLGTRRRTSVLFTDGGQRRDYFPEEIAQDIIAWMIERVETHLGHKITECVITHPSTFAPSQLEALKRAFTRCGVEVGMMMHEPVAAALEYILSHKPSEPSYTLMVYDFGGGTIDITLLQVEDHTDPLGQRVITPKILGVGGRRWFGGDDVTEVVAQELGRQFNDWLKRKYEDSEGDLLRTDKRAIDAMANPDERRMATLNRALIWERAERLKIELSNDPDPNPRLAITDLVLKFLHEGQEKSDTPRADFSGGRLNEMINPDLDSTIEIMQAMLCKAGLERPDIILLAGQSSRLRLVREVMAQHFARHTGVSPLWLR